MELVKPVEPVLWASIVELVIGGTGYGTVEALVATQKEQSPSFLSQFAFAPFPVGGREGGDRAMMMTDKAFCN